MVRSGIYEEYYKFKETGNRIWIIAGNMKVIRILTEEERQGILQGLQNNEVEAYATYKAGFEKKIKTENC